MFKITFFLSIGLLLTGVAVQAQSITIRKQLQQQYTTNQVVQAIKQIEQADSLVQRSLQQYQNQNSTFRTRFVDDENYYEANRIERNTIIYFKTHNAISRQISGVDRLTTSNEGGNNTLLGQGMFVGIIDGDLAFDKHQEFNTTNQPRVYLVDTWDQNLTEEAKDFSLIERRRNHATHVLGTLIAGGKNQKAKGMAPQAQAYSYTWTNDMVKLSYLAKNGVLVSNHSYGLAAIDDQKKPLLSVDYFGAYTLDAVNMDKIAYLYPYLQPVVSAGNDRMYTEIINPEKKGMDLLLGHANSKNAIVVGAIGANNNAILTETEFSSYGPTNDFRIKPDIVAIGQDVFSSAYAYRYKDGEKEKNNLYATLSGTSMAAPSVSGILLLWQQWALANQKFPYKAATIKGVMINSAGNFSLTAGPDARTGWGIINAWGGIQLLEAAKNKQAIVREETLVENKEKTLKVQLNEQANILSFTICWTDVEGQNREANFGEYNGNKVLVNDLDIRVYKNGVEYLPWKLTESFTESMAIRGDNNVDNVERIDIPNPALGEYEVKVTHKGKLLNQVQDYALIVNSDHFKGVSIEGEGEPMSKTEIRAWPNPTTAVLNIEIPNDFVFDALDATIYDATGKSIQRVPIQATNRQVIHVSSLSKGMYFLKLKGGGKTYQVKFIKK